MSLSCFNIVHGIPMPTSQKSWHSGLLAPPFWGRWAHQKTRWNSWRCQLIDVLPWANHLIFWATASSLEKKEGTNWIFNQCEMAVQTVKAEQRCSIFITISIHILLLIFCNSDPLYILNRYPATLPLISLNGYTLLPPLPVCYLEWQSIHYCSLPPLNPPK